MPRIDGSRIHSMQWNNSDNITILKILCYVKDNGYDSKTFPRQIRKDVHTYSVIPICSGNNENYDVIYCQKCLARLITSCIHDDNSCWINFLFWIESSMDLKERRFQIQIKNIANKMNPCNIHRFLQFLKAEVFL